MGLRSAGEMDAVDRRWETAMSTGFEAVSGERSDRGKTESRGVSGWGVGDGDGEDG